MSLQKRVEKLKEVLERPNHFFTKTKRGRIIIIFQTDDRVEPEELSFTGSSMADAVKQAEDWTVHEKEMGAL